MYLRILKLYISIFVFIFDVLSRNIQHLLLLNEATTLVVLYYHDVPKSARLLFAKQMDILLRNAIPVSIPLDSELRRANHFAAITFDDGFLNVFNNAMPEMQSRHIPSIIFVTAGYLGQYSEWIRSHNFNEERYRIVDKSVLSNTPSLVKIGSHTLSHPHLTELTPDLVLKELRDSKHILEQVCQTSIDLISYPHGSFDNSILEIAEVVGYRYHFSIEPTRNKIPLDTHLIGRVRVDPTDWPIEFRLKLLGCYRWMEFASKLKNVICC